MLFRELADWIQDKLRQLSREGYVYIGRTGAGLTRDFRRLCMKEGTVKAIDRTMEWHDLEDKLLIEMIATEGPRWVPYVRIHEYCTTGAYNVLRQKNPSP